MAETLKRYPFTKCYKCGSINYIIKTSRSGVNKSRRRYKCKDCKTNFSDYDRRAYSIEMVKLVQFLGAVMNSSEQIKTVTGISTRSIKNMISGIYRYNGSRGRSNKVISNFARHHEDEDYYSFYAVLGQVEVYVIKGRLSSG